MSDFFIVENLIVSYGEAVALRDVSLAVSEGSIVTIIGANGAGKTTLVNTIAGILRLRSGHIWLRGRDLAQVEPHRICDYGIAIVPEGRRLFTRLTVFDNLMMGANVRHARSAEKQTLDFVYHIFPRLAERRRQIAGTLSGGEQQMVAIGRALMAKPQMLLLDEPSLGLAPIIVTSIFEVIGRANREAGVTILLVEQNATKALQIAQYAYVISDGQITQHGAPSVLMADDTIQKAYLGL